MVGHSFGATLAFAYAVAHPDRTVALGYVGGVGVGAWREPYRRERRRRMTDEQWARLESLEVAFPVAEAPGLRMPCWFVHGGSESVTRGSW